ncbi:MAG: glycine/sarcosine/betaine reductase complex component C subunit alpha [Lachnospiraceae bacterium]
MSEANIKKMIADTFLEVADALETGQFGKKPVIGFASEGSEHGKEDVEYAFSLAKGKNYVPYLIEGEDAHGKMEQLLESGEIDAAVTMHYPFPVGVSTVGKIITPARGRAMYLATTTGTSDTDRVAAMVRNAIYGIIAAKADGVEHPTVGIANIDGARQTEKYLLKLKENGYDINFATSARADGGIVMRGNDLLAASADVMVMDSLTGNLMTKLFSAYSTGGSYEAVGFGYGPGIGKDFDKLIMIVSRASGAPVVAGAMEYAASLIAHDWKAVAKEEFKKVEAAGFNQILDEIKKPAAKAAGAEEEVKMPPKEVCTAQIPGIEVMDLEDAVKVLWKNGIYAESGMGCTGPIVLMADDKKEKAAQLLTEAGYIG